MGFLTLQFDYEMIVKVLDNGDKSKSVALTDGMKQGCVLAPTLFSIIFSEVSTDAFYDYADRVELRYRLNILPP